MKSLYCILLLLVLGPRWGSTQPAQGELFPTITLAEENGGKLGGGAWKCSDIKGRPCLIVVINPDHQDMLAPIEKAIGECHLQTNEGSLVKVMDTQSSWKPDGMIQAGAWLSHLAGKVDEARKNGIVQALFTDRKSKPANWSVVYDQNRVFRNELHLNDRPIHIFLLDKRGVIVSYHSGKPSDTNARVWMQMIKNLGASS